MKFIRRIALPGRTSQTQQSQASTCKSAVAQLISFHPKLNTLSLHVIYLCLFFVGHSGGQQDFLISRLQVLPSIICLWVLSWWLTSCRVIVDRLLENPHVLRLLHMPERHCKLNPSIASKHSNRYFPYATHAAKCHQINSQFMHLALTCKFPCHR